MALTACNIRTSPQGRELKLHGTALFPVACYYDDLTTESLPWHWHDELETLIVVEGTAAVTAGTESFTVRQGEGFFCNTGVLHAAWNAGHASCLLHSVVFHPRLVGGSIDSVFWQDYLQPLLENLSCKSVLLDGSAQWHRNGVISIENAWKFCMEEPSGYEFSVRTALSELVFLLSSNRPTVSVPPSERSLREAERIKTMLQFIQEHYPEELDTAQIAASARVSVSECLRCFRNTIGVPPIQYLKQFRIQKAAELLATTDWKIAEIATQCGFQDMSYFARTFRELKGSAPTEYRNRARLANSRRG